MQSSCVWITGASSGLGRATALAFARKGACVAVSARSRAALEELVAESAGLSGSIHAFPLDITDRGAVMATLTSIEAHCGFIDRAILNAGTHRPIETEKGFDLAAFDELIALNLIGTANCIAALMPGMLQRRHGQLALVASIAGYRGLKTASVYGASKAALINMAEALRFDLKDIGIDVRLVNPGFIATPLTAKNPFSMPFLMKAEDAAESLWRGLVQRKDFEIVFPRSFAYIMKIVRLLPYRIYFPLVGRITNA